MFIAANRLTVLAFLARLAFLVLGLVLGEIKSFASIFRVVSMHEQL